MFIEIKEFLIPVREIKYIKRIGSGVRVAMSSGTLDIVDVSDSEYEGLKARLCSRAGKEEE